MTGMQGSLTAAESIRVVRPPRHRPRRSSTGAILASLALLTGTIATIALPGEAQAASFVVDTDSDTVDVSPGDGFCADSGGTCSLRAAVMEANALGGTHDITISRPEAGPQAYPITIADTGSDSDANGDLDISADISITVAPRPELDIVPGFGFNDRAFRVAPGGSLTLSRINVRSFNPGENGGGILNEGNLTLGCGVHVENNTGIDGGGIHTTGTLTSNGAAAVRNNTAARGGNIFAAAGSTTVHSLNPACPADLQIGEGTANEGASVFAQGPGTTIDLNHNVGVHDNSATTSGGAFQVIDGAELRFRDGQLQISNTVAPAGAVAFLRNGGRFAINPGPPGFSVDVVIDGAIADPGGALFDASEADLELTDTEVVNSLGHMVRSDGNARFEALRMILKAGGGGDDGIVLTDGAIARLTTSYIANRATAIRIEDGSQIELISTTLIDNGTAAAIGPSANVSFRGVWVVRNGTTCTRSVDVLDNSAVSDGNCGGGPGSITDPSAGSEIISYPYGRSGVFGPGPNSAVVNLYPAPCLASPDLGFRDRPGPGDPGCEPGAVESDNDDDDRPPLPEEGPIISGTLVHDGTLEPAVEACAGAFLVDTDRDGGPITVSKVSPDSAAWKLGPLPVGEYMVAFYPCVPDTDGEYDDSSALVPEFWENVPIEVESENPFVGGVVFDVTTSDISGIDACIGTSPDGGDSTCGGARTTEQPDPNPPATPPSTTPGSTPPPGAPLRVAG